PIVERQLSSQPIEAIGSHHRHADTRARPARPRVRLRRRPRVPQHPVLSLAKGWPGVATAHSLVDLAPDQHRWSRESNCVLKLSLGRRHGALMSGRSNGDDRARSVRLPEGSAAAYAAWVSFVSLSEERLRKRPSLLRKASSAGFVTTKPAKIAHRVLLGPLAQQAGEALSEAESPTAMVRPILIAR